jgi:hypothetical protein
MKEIIVTVDAKDKKKVMMDCSVAGLSRYVTAHEEYDDINYRVNTYAKKELQKIFNHVNTEEGKKQLMFCEEQELKYKASRQSFRRPVSEDIDNLNNLSLPYTPSTWSTSSQNILNPIPLSSSVIMNSVPRIDPRQKRKNDMLEWVNTLPGLLMLNEIQVEALMKSFEEFSKSQ